VGVGQVKLGGLGREVVDAGGDSLLVSAARRGQRE
jgi:hypothetical protein